MNQKERGIILKKCLSREHHFVVLSEHHGKIVARTPIQAAPPRLHPGGLIWCARRSGNGSGYVVLTQEPTKHYFHAHCSDLYWCHHLLEICYFFAPLDQPASELFQFLYESLELATMQHVFGTAWNNVQTLCTALLLIELGFYPPPALCEPVLGVKKIIALCLYSKKNFETHDFVGTYFPAFCMPCFTELDSWILGCIHSHPRVAQFKTLTFMYNHPQRIKRGT